MKCVRTPDDETIGNGSEDEVCARTKSNETAGLPVDLRKVHGSGVGNVGFVWFVIQHWLIDKPCVSIVP